MLVILCERARTLPNVKAKAGWQHWDTVFSNGVKVCTRQSSSKVGLLAAGRNHIPKLRCLNWS